jgi:hypothetical protein
MSHSLLQGHFAFFYYKKALKAFFHMVIFIIIWEDCSIVIKGSVVMKMAYKISAAVIVLLSMALLALPAAAQFGCGLGGCGAPCGGCGPVAYGPPQDCVATISCNIPVTTQVPVMTATVVPQQVPVTVPVCDVCPVTVPRVVVVPQTIPVPVVKPACSAITVPVSVPVCSSVPVTSCIPQCYTVPLGCGGAPMANAPYGGVSKDMGLGKGMGTNMGMGANMGIPAAYQANIQSALGSQLASRMSAPVE